MKITIHSSNKILICLIVSLIFASAISFIFKNNVKDRFFQKIEITDTFSLDSIIIQKLIVASKSNPFTSKKNILIRKINYLAYDKNKPCGKINRINNVVPVVITEKNNSIFIEIISEDKNILNLCKELILKEINNENIEIVKFYNEIITRSGSVQDNNFYEFDIKNFLNLYSEFSDEVKSQKKFSDNDLNSLFKVYVQELFEYRTFLKPISNDQLDYWMTFVDEDKIEKTSNLYLVFAFSFVFTFIICLQVLFRNQKKISLIYLVKKIFN